MNPICYLCGEEISNETPTGDHVISQQFITRDQPKVNGFDYGSKLPTHHNCNTRFGPEKMCSKALQVLGAYKNQIYTNSQDPTISIQPFRKEELGSFSKKDFEFFGLIDTTNHNYKDWAHSLDFFKDKKKANPLKKALNIATSVLVKNAAALLVKRFNVSPRSYWNVLCMPYQTLKNTPELDAIFGNTKPFEIGVKVWIKKFDNNTDYIVRYKNQKADFIMIFSFFQDEKYLKYCTVTFRDTERLLFKSPRLIDLVNYNWKRMR